MGLSPSHNQSFPLPHPAAAVKNQADPSAYRWRHRPHTPLLPLNLPDLLKILSSAATDALYLGFVPAHLPLKAGHIVQRAKSYWP